MERTSRQSVVLDDTVLRGHFTEEAREATRMLSNLVGQGLPNGNEQLWRTHLATIENLLTGPPETAMDRDRQLALVFRDLELVNSAISAQVQQTIQQRNQSLEVKLDSSRLRLRQQVTWAIVLAVAMALAFGIWFTVPLQRLEHAIVKLGENRLDQVIRIRGPADLMLVGQRLDWLRLRLVELDADKSRFLRHISHELKTPLASMREGVSLLEDGVAGELNQDQREIAQILRHNTGVLQGQIEDLLRLNTAAFEARQLHRQSTDLRELVESQVDAQRLQWRARELTVEIIGERVLVALDPEKIGVVLANLLSNAIRYSPLQSTIRLELSTLPGLVCIDIRDQGAGVALVDRERIFEPFYRGERQPTDVVRGSGIGLSIVHEYVAAHGGRIELLAEPVGAHFRMELPHVFTS
jgi:two-component system sensor histidine kinase GlrK